jgi:hypothetical protein
LRDKTFSFGETNLLAPKAKDRFRMLISDSDAFNFDDNHSFRTELKTVLEKLSVYYAANLATTKLAKKKSGTADVAMEQDKEDA